MRAHYLQHVAFEDLGCIEPWLRCAGYEISSTQFYLSRALPEVNEIDLLIIMGGPMGVHDTSKYPWLLEEKEFIRRAIGAGKPVLGVCLGAQLIAAAMGGELAPSPVKEIGWFPVEGVATDNSAVFRFPEAVDVFHWHGDTFSLPRGAVRLAGSQSCHNQAFQIGSKVIGLQFHLEMTPASVQSIVENCRADLIVGKYVQSAAEILAVPREHYATTNALMGAILEYLHV